MLHCNFIILLKAHVFLYFTDDTLEKTPKIEEKNKSAKYAFTGARQRKFYLTSTPKSNKENQIDFSISPILQNKKCKMGNWNFSITPNSSENNMKDLSLISLKPDSCKKSTETNSEHTYSTRKSTVVNERNCEDIQCLVDNEKLIDIIYSLENFSVGKSDELLTNNQTTVTESKVCVPFTRDAVLQRCHQCNPISFSEAYTSR